jgi:prophage DNA circulation protein
MPLPLWRSNLQPASFRGVPFYVRTDAKAGGRRIVQHEFPMQDTPFAEDMGRRARRFRVGAYVLYSPALMPDYQAARDALITALETSGSAQLIHPTLGVDTVVVDTYSVSEHLEEAGGYSEFEIEFFEAGSTAYATPAPDTNANVTKTAQDAIQTFQQSPSIVALMPAPGTIGAGSNLGSNLGQAPGITPTNPLGTLGS